MIKTMTNFTPQLEDATDDQLKHLIGEASPNFASLASDELTRRVSKKLNIAMIVLTLAILVLTAVLVWQGVK